MDFSLTEAEQDLVDLCRDFAQKEIATRAPLAWEEARCPTDLLREMGELGLLGMLVPEEWGGIGMSTIGFVAAMEQIGLADQSVAAAWQAHVTIGSLPLLLFGNDEQRERWLRPLAEGRVLGAFGLTEPDAGSDARGIRTRAERTRRRLADQRPQDVHLQRRHRHVLRRDAAGPHRATRRADVRHASSSRRTRPASPWARRCAASGGRASTPASCSSTTCGCPTSTSSAIPTSGSASSCARSRSAASRSPRCRSASPRPCSTWRPPTRKERVQFGQPISKFQAVQFKLADIATELEAARWLTYRAAYLRDTGQPFLKEAAMAKLKASRLADVGGVGGRADPRRPRLHARDAGRPLLLRLEGARDRRGHQRDPAPRHRPRPRLLTGAARSS